MWLKTWKKVRAAMSAARNHVCSRWCSRLQQIALFERCTHFNDHGWPFEAGAGRRMCMIKTVVTFVDGMIDRNLVDFNVAGHVNGRLVMITGSSTPSHVLHAACPSDNRVPSESY